ALTAGCIPFSALLLTDAVYEAVASDSGLARFRSTLSVNRLATAVATAVLDVIDREKLLENAQARSAQLMAGLTVLKEKNIGITDVHGSGLLIAFKVASTTDRDDTTASMFCVNALHDNAVMTSIALNAPE